MSGILTSEVVTSSPDSEAHYIDTHYGLWFYDRLMQKEYAPNIYKRLLDGAEEKVYIWDSYLQEQDLRLFEDIASDIEVWILTCFNLEKMDAPHHGFINGLIEIQNEKHFTLHVAAINKGTINNEINYGMPDSERKCIGATLPHDRFLFVDDRIFFVGSSLNYHSALTANKVSTTAIYEIKEECNKKFLQQHYESYWDANSNRGKYVKILYPIS